MIYLKPNEPKELAGILRSMVEGGVPDNLYTQDQADGDAFVARAADLLEQLAAYAERYKYLRERHWSDSDICCVTKPKDNVLLGSWCPHGELLDKYIDERRGK